jgi:hypothetical protein
MSKLYFYIFVIGLGLFYIFSIVKGFIMCKTFCDIFLVCIFLFYLFCVGVMLYDIFSPMFCDNFPVSEFTANDSFRAKMFKENSLNRYKVFNFSGGFCSNMQSYKSTEYDKVCSFANQE